MPLKTRVRDGVCQRGEGCCGAAMKMPNILMTSLSDNKKTQSKNKEKSNIWVS